MYENEKGIAYQKKIIRPLKYSVKPKGKSRNFKWPFMRMEVGDSFSFPESSRNSVHARAGYIKKKFGYVFSIRSTSDECRIWRVS